MRPIPPGVLCKVYHPTSLVRAAFHSFLHRSSKQLYLHPHSEKSNMLIIPVKEGEPIDKALKKFKKKFDRTGKLRELRRRQYFTKPSVERRTEKLRAVYKLETYGGEQ